MDLAQSLIDLVAKKGTEILFNKDLLLGDVSGCFNQAGNQRAVFEACVDGRFFSHAYYKKNLNEILFLRHKLAVDYSEKCGIAPESVKYVLDSFLKLAGHLRGISILGAASEKDASAFGALAGAVKGLGSGNYRPAINALNTLTSADMSLAHHYLGKCYLEGSGVAKDLEKAAKCFTKGAAAGSSYATYNLGSCYLKGLGVKKDTEKGISYLIQAADMGQEDAVFAVGYMYKDNIEKNPADIKKAIVYLQASADYGNWSAAITICDLYYEDAKTTGNFGRTSIAKDRIANVKDPEACYKIAQIYERGLGVSQNIEKALNFSTKAATKGYPGAAEMMKRLGSMKLGK